MSTTRSRMNTWRELIIQWGRPNKDPAWNVTRSQEAWAKSLGISFTAAEKQYQRNSVNPRHFQDIVARAPQVGLQGITLDFLFSLKGGRAVVRPRFPRETANHVA
jgi:hypothetical protein